MINEKDSSPDVVHLATCPTIQHQIDEAEREEQASHSYEYLGKNEDGHSIILEKRESQMRYFHAHYVTIVQLEKWPRRYRRCGLCSPEVPESRRKLQPDIERMKARSIGQRHLGREYIGIGPLRSICMSSDGYELVGDEGVLSVPLDGEVEYRKQ